LDSKKFHLPQSLRGKVFRADEFFREKQDTAGSSPILDRLSGVRIVRDETGSFVHRRVAIPLDRCVSEEGYLFPGGYGLPDFDAEGVRNLSGEDGWDAAHPRSLLFFDVETTGLAGGSGTCPFLCGVGYFEENAFVVEQFFMEDFPQEGVMLSHLAREIAKASAFVTYNGKCFDIPLLATRLTLHRQRLNLEIPHIDLLHHARRVWRGAFSDCRLETIETSFFGLKRARDIESHLIPQIYFQYIRGRRREMILPVFDHNVQDIATLGALVLMFCRSIRTPLDCGLRTPEELYGLGRLLLGLGRADKALECLREALVSARDRDFQEMLLLYLGRFIQEDGTLEEALETWDTLMKVSPAHRLAAAVEIAKYHEHRGRDPEKARQVLFEASGRSALLADLESYLSGPGAEDAASISGDLELRLSRLERKISGRKPGSPQ